MGLISNKSSITSSARKRMIVIVALGSGRILAAVLVLLAVLLLISRKKKMRPVETSDWQSGHSRITVETASNSVSADLNLGLRIPYDKILLTTNKFDSKLMIGEGGFGKVYKGTLMDVEVAVKRCEQAYRQGFSEFETEIVILSKIRHRHLVSLVGYCDERGEMILVYEFMEKGTLRDHLYSSEGSTLWPKLSWDARLRICIGAAKGLHYLHAGSSEVIIHRDIKSTNILLDKDYVAKVADFGISCSTSIDKSHVSAAQVKGSFGYFDPEYFKFLQLTQKSDVYSFGVVLLEVLCARPAVGHRSLPWEEASLAEWGISSIKQGDLEKIIDPVLEINPNSLRKFGETVEKCLRARGSDRPAMVDVLWDLEYCLLLQNLDVNTAVNEDSAMGLGMHVFERLPSNTVGEEETGKDSRAFEESNRVGLRTV